MSLRLYPANDSVVRFAKTSSVEGWKVAAVRIDHVSEYREVSPVEHHILVDVIARCVIWN